MPSIYLRLGMFSLTTPQVVNDSLSRADLYLREIEGWQTKLGTSGWSCKTVVDGAFEWRFFHPPHFCLPAVGFKCHISIDVWRFHAEINVVLSLLEQYAVAFKISSTLEGLVRLANGQGGVTQIGKSITVYCQDERQAYNLANHLDQLLGNSRGPLVMGESVLSDFSRVSLRYGSFESFYVWDEFGRPKRHQTTGQDCFEPDNISLTGRVQPALERRGMILRSFRHLSPNDVLICGGRKLAPIVKLKSYPREVYRVIDVENGDEFIAKRAWTGTFVDAFGCGSEKRQRLRREYEILCYLYRKDFRVSRPVGVIEGNEWTMLVTGVGAGQALGQKPTADPQSLGLALARHLIGLHQLNLVHRDIKPGNILWNGQDVTLIDYELASFTIDDGVPLLGSRHYTAPEVWIGVPPSPAADIYAFGSVLVSLWLGFDIALLPGLPSPEMLSHAQVPTVIQELVQACWNADPGRRPTAVDTVAILETLILNARVRDEDQTSEGGPFELGESPAKFASACGAITRRFAETVATGMVYRNAHLFSSHHLEGINIGAAGIILGLVTLDEVAGTEFFAHDVRSAANTLAMIPPSIKSAGLYTGNAGVALALGVVGQRFGREDLLAAARTRFMAATREVSEDDLFSGRAGVILASDILTEITGDMRYLEGVLPVVGELLSRIKLHAGVLGVAASGALDGVRGCFTGAAHGAAGLALALARFATRVGDQAIKSLSLRMYQSIFDRACDVKRGVIFRISGRSDQSAAPGTWCHGPLGILWCLLQDDATIEGLPEMIDWCVREIVANIGLNNPTYCHGLAGVLETFRLLHAVSPRHQRQAALVQVRVAKQLWLQRQITRQDEWVWGAEEPTIITPDLMVGSLAPATALALWQKQETFPVISAPWLARCANGSQSLQMRRGTE
jgi:Lanthionine synthetase C-like protein/Protein kinase domain